MYGKSEWIRYIDLDYSSDDSLVQERSDKTKDKHDDHKVSADKNEVGKAKSKHRSRLDDLNSDNSIKYEADVTERKNTESEVNPKIKSKWHAHRCLKKL